ncbi:MAG: class II aldolase/adducin family protein [Oscillospiraceae bacterium]|nr:class II aldolase/adducin family protein [Oscillospiraceae bacterium]
MDIITAKEAVINAGKKLVEYGLIARTWGNVSCRISDTQFVITPSGKPYESLTTDDIVTVNISDLSYDGDVKPSSEKGIHAQCYALRPDINFVIHTHQMNASVVSALGLDITGLEGRSREIIGNEIVVSGYGLPGTKNLRDGVVSALGRTNSKAIIMAHHGAICLGKDYEDAFAVANEVELVCSKFILRKYKVVTGKAADTLDAVAKYIGDKFRVGDQAIQLERFDSMRNDEIMVLLDKSGKEILTVDFDCPPDGEDIPREAAVHMSVYKSRKDVNYVIHSDLPEIYAMSIKGKKLKPLLDDFAQIAGATVKAVAYKDSNRVVKKVGKALKGGRNAVLLKDNGALCCGKDKYNAEATEMVVDKNCKAYIGSELFGKTEPIKPLEAKLMNIVYRFKYSKQAN